MFDMALKRYVGVQVLQVTQANAAHVLQYGGLKKRLGLGFHIKQRTLHFVAGFEY